MSTRILDRDINEPSSQDLPASAGDSLAEVKAEAPTPEVGTRTESVPTIEETPATPESWPRRRITFDWLAEMSHVRLTDLTPDNLPKDLPASSGASNAEIKVEAPTNEESTALFDTGSPRVADITSWPPRDAEKFSLGEKTLRGPGEVRIGEDGGISFITHGADRDPAEAVGPRPISTVRPVVEIQGRLRRAMKRGALQSERLVEVAEEIARELEASGYDTAERLVELKGWVEALVPLVIADEEARGPRDYIPFWVPWDVRAWLAPEARPVEGDEGEAERWALPPGTPNVFAPDGTGYELPSVFYIDPTRDALADMGPGTIDEPFKTFWPVRMWFALIEWLEYYYPYRDHLDLPDVPEEEIPRWDFSDYHPVIYLFEGKWTLEEEYGFGHEWVYGDGSLRAVYGSGTRWYESPPFTSIYEGMSELNANDYFNAFSLAWKHLKGSHVAATLLDDTAVDFDSAYGGELKLLNACFLKIPRGLTGVTICGLEGENARIEGCLCVYDDDGMTWGENNDQLARCIGKLSKHEPCQVTDDVPEVFLFHENHDIRVQGITFKGFRTALHFLGACQDVAVFRCRFEYLESWGISVGLVEYFDYLEWDQPLDQARSCAVCWPVLFRDSPSDFRFFSNAFYRIGQGSDATAIGLGTSVSNVEIFNCAFVECVDGVMVDTGTGSGLHIHHNRFICCLETRIEENGLGHGDGNGIDLKTIRPRTVEEIEDFEIDVAELPRERWTRVHDNWFMGNVGGALIMHKGVGWVQIYNNTFVDNCVGIGISPKGVSMYPLYAVVSGELHQEPTTGALDHVNWSATKAAAHTEGIPYRFAFWDPCGVYAPGWRSPFDEIETDAEDRLVFTIESVYIYRNVIAASWSHGMEIAEGVVTLSCERTWGYGTREGDPTTKVMGFNVAGGTRGAYALTLRDIVIAHNTIDSNGGNWMKAYPCSCPLSDTSKEQYDVQAIGYGILLTRSTTSALADSAEEYRTRATGAGDGYEKVAIYNNILSNNYSYQLFLMDSSLYAEAFENLHDLHTEHNITTRPRWRIPEGILWSRHVAIDYNAYFYEGMDSTGTRSIVFTHLDVTTSEEDSTESRMGTGVEGRLSDQVVVTTFASEEAWSRAAEDRARYCFDDVVAMGAIGTIYDQLGLELNRVEISSYADLYDLEKWVTPLELIRTFRFSTSLREVYSGDEIVQFYQTWCDEDWRPWQTRPESGLSGRGANGPGTFPDETVHLDTGLPLFVGPDIDGTPSFGLSNIGAYQIPE